MKKENKEFIQAIGKLIFVASLIGFVAGFTYAIFDTEDERIRELEIEVNLLKFYQEKDIKCRSMTRLGNVNQNGYAEVECTTWVSEW